MSGGGWLLVASAFILGVFVGYLIWPLPEADEGEEEAWWAKAP